VVKALYGENMKVKIQKLTPISLEIQVKEKMPNGAFKQIGVILHNVQPSKILTEKRNPELRYIELFDKNKLYTGNIYWFNVKPTVKLSET